MFEKQYSNEYGTITPKQKELIKRVLIKRKHYQLDEFQLQNLTKQEASGIINRNIVQKRPLHIWYAYGVGNNIYSCQVQGNNKYTIRNKKTFIKKRLLDEYYGIKTHQKAPWYFKEKDIYYFTN